MLIPKLLGSVMAWLLPPVRMSSAVSPSYWLSQLLSEAFAKKLLLPAYRLMVLLFPSVTL